MKHSIIDNHKDIHVAFSADNNFAIPMVTAARSLIENLHDEYRAVLYLLSDRISNHNKRKISRSLSYRKTVVHWIEIKDALDETGLRNVPTRLPKATYGRCLLSSVVPKDVEYVLYLDCDLIVLDDVIKMMAKYRSHQYPISAAPNLGPTTFQNAFHLHELPAVKNIPDERMYFNSGVMIVNLAKWRKADISNKLFQFVKSNSHALLFSDQDALNVLFTGKWKRIAPRWNQIHLYHSLDTHEGTGISAKEWQMAKTDPGIVHFTTATKPWQKNCSHPFRDIFFTYLDKTTYAGWRNTFIRRAFQRMRRTLQN